MTLLWREEARHVRRLNPDLSGTLTSGSVLVIVSVPAAGRVSHNTPVTLQHFFVKKKKVVFPKQLGDVRQT